MLTIRLQRLGKTHYATYRLVVQDVHSHPTSGKVIAYVGSYNPHTKEVQLDKETATKFLTNGAQPTDRVSKILAGQGIELPKWVKLSAGTKKRAIRNPEKLRRNQPKEEAAEVAEEAAETSAE
ncbi:MAG: 30S ribosomal protein S16 [Candidatus Saccharibacteria bacterium]|nr:30S ribosomal protein S16 [Candidatus Saccharibacteria bacterium]